VWNIWRSTSRRQKWFTNSRYISITLKATTLFPTQNLTCLLLTIHSKNQRITSSRPHRHCVSNSPRSSKPRCQWWIWISKQWGFWGSDGEGWGNGIGLAQYMDSDEGNCFIYWSENWTFVMLTLLRQNP